jgi:hypothetical protein
MKRRPQLFALGTLLGICCLWLISISCSPKNGGSSTYGSPLCRIVGTVYVKRIGGWTNLEEILLYRNGSYILHYTNVWTVGSMSNLTRTGFVDSSLVLVLSNSIRNSRVWEQVGLVPTYRLPVDDSMSFKPDGVEKLNGKVWYDYYRSLSNSINTNRQGMSNGAVRQRIGPK